MALVSASLDERLEPVVQRLSALSIADRYNPYEYFKWPETLPDDIYWWSPELLTVAGTTVAAKLDEAALHRLSRWESLHFYSLNVHGIRELLGEVVTRIHMPGFEGISPFLHHFMAEENDHMWYFAEFCRRYGKIYPDRAVKMTEIQDPLVASLLAFARIEIFEEIVDYFNMSVGRDETMHPFIREINAMHHRDESRHIAFGRKIVAALHEDLRARGDAAALEQVESYLGRYLTVSIQSLYNPAVYRDAALPIDPYELRRTLLADPARKKAHARILQRPQSFLLQQGILTKEIEI